MTAYDKLIHFYHSQEKAADALGVTRQTVTAWKKNGIPAKRALQIEEATKGKITIRDILK